MAVWFQYFAVDDWGEMDDAVGNVKSPNDFNAMMLWLIERK